MAELVSERGPYSSSSSRVFRRRVSGVTLTAGERPRVRFVGGGEEDLGTEGAVTEGQLSSLCSRFGPYDPITGRCGIPGTLHRIRRFPPPSPAVANANANDLTPQRVELRLGRRRPSRECSAVVSDLCHRLFGTGERRDNDGEGGVDASSSPSSPVAVRPPSSGEGGAGLLR